MTHTAINFEVLGKKGCKGLHWT